MITEQIYNASSTTEYVVDGFDIEGWTNAPLRLQHAIRLAAPRTDVFALIADHGRIPEWFPMVAQVDVCNQHADAPGGIGAIRYCTLTNGVVMAETILACNAPQLLCYAIHEDNVFGLRNHLGVITLEVTNAHAADDHTILTWQHYFNHTNPGAMVAKLDANLRVGLQNLMDHFGGEWRDSGTTIY